MTLSVVVPAYNGEALLADTLRAIQSALAGLPDSELIVIVDGATDKTAELLATGFPGVKAVLNPENLGYIPSVNRGVREAQGDLVALFHQDVRPKAGALAKALGHFSDPATFAVSFRTKEEKVGPARPCRHAVGAHCVFRKSMFLELGSLDPLFSPFFYEDVDLGYRAWKKGWRSIYEPACEAVHAGDGSLLPLYGATAFRRIRERNALFFKFKNLDGFRFAVFLAGLALRAAFSWASFNLEFYRVLSLAAKKKWPVLLSRNARIRRGETGPDAAVGREKK